MVQLNLINFSLYLKHNKLQSFCRWFLLNMCVREFHPAQLNLAHLPEDDVIFIGLSKYFSPTFLKLSSQENKTLESKMILFKKYQQSCAIIT